MKSVILFICLFFSYFTLATSVPMEEVIFTDSEIENLPPVDEMIGVPVAAPEHLGDADADNGFDERKVEEAEIQLAHGGRCKRHHGGYGCGRGRRHRPSPPVIVVEPPIVVIPQPVVPVSNVCRNGLAYCYTAGILPIGTYCECHSIYGWLILTGRISSY